MSGRDVRFDRVELGRVLGISRNDGFTLQGFAPGVNLVHGPNGSGKSTTVRVIQELLWPGRTELERATISGKFHEGAAKWSVTIEAGTLLETSRDGQGGVTPDFGPAEERHRYHLALHDLIVAHDADFAREIQQASQGGFDLEAVAEACGFRAKPSKPRGLAHSCAQAAGALDDAKRQEAELASLSQDLSRLARERDAADEAGAEIALLEKARELLAAEERRRELEARLAALPDVLTRLQGDERTRLDGFAAREREASNGLADGRDRIARADADMEALALPSTDAEPSLLADLKAKQRRLVELQGDLRRTRAEVAAADTAATAASARLGAELTGQQRTKLNAVELPGLVEFTREVARVDAERASLEARRRWLEPKPDDGLGDHDTKRLQEGVTALAHWLAVPGSDAPPPVGRSWLRIAAALFMAFAFVAVGVLFHPALFAGVVLAIIVVLEDLRGPKAPADDVAGNARAVHRKSFEKTALPAPSSWTVDAVDEEIRSLTRSMGPRALEDARQRKREELADAERTFREKEAALADRSDALGEELGLAVELDVQWLPTLVENLVTWQRKTSDAEVARGSLRLLEEEERGLLAQGTAALAPWGVSSMEGAEALAGALHDLEARQTLRREKRALRDEARRNIESVFAPARDSVAEEKRVFFEGLQLAETEAHRIDAWLTELTRFRGLEQELADARAICANHAGALDGRDDLRALALSTVEQRIHDDASRLASRDAVIEDIARIESRVAASRGGFGLADAAAALARAKAELADEKEVGDAAIVGAGLAEWVRTVAIETTRPQVFHRAKELFVSFTKGALHLALDDAATPARFLARRGSQPGRPVEQLSVGERVQLLMAVRIAFLEQNETARLPLLMDEILGTSDDERAAAIIDTVVEIARDGRQVFYFTAQHDEVGKWIARLEQEHIEHSVIDLGAVRNLNASSRAPLVITPVLPASPPPPNGRDHRAYGDLLGVPNLDPAVGHLDDLHLWHLVEDVDVLHQLLEKGIVTWAQLQTLRDHGGLAMLALAADSLARIGAAERVVQSACVAWREGRGKPVDRDTLIDSGCVSEKFVDRVTDLARSLHGDGAQLLEALANREVSGWRSAATEQLRTYLDSGGFISERTPLSLDEIRIRALSAGADALREGRLDVSTVDRVVGSLPRDEPRSGRPAR